MSSSTVVSFLPPHTPPPPPPHHPPPRSTSFFLSARRFVTATSQQARVYTTVHFPQYSLREAYARPPSLLFPHCIHLLRFYRARGLTVGAFFYPVHKQRALPLTATREPVSFSGLLSLSFFPSATEDQRHALFSTYRQMD